MLTRYIYRMFTYNNKAMFTYNNKACISILHHIYYAYNYITSHILCIYITSYILCIYITSHILCIYITSYILCIYITSYILCIYITSHILCIYITSHIYYAYILHHIYYAYIYIVGECVLAQSQSLTLQIDLGTLSFWRWNVFQMFLYIFFFTF